MRVGSFKTRRVRFARLAVPLAILVLFSVIPTQAQVPGVQQIAQNGFEDTQNSYSWSMAWFNDKLYVGTARSWLCVEAATLDFYYGPGYYPPSPPEPDISCPADRYELDLRAEIWQYTPQTGVWNRVYQSPTVANPVAPDKQIARDIGYRGMVVHREPDGTEALYVGGVTANEYIPELAGTNPPRILRTTDGETFAPLAGSLGPIITETVGEQFPMGYRAMASYDNRLFVTASGGIVGDGVLIEIKNPSSPTPEYVQVSQGFQLYELEVFNGFLYAGAGATNSGYSVWKSNATGSPPYQFTPVVTNGAGRGALVNSVVAMQVFGNRLYVGSNGVSSLIPPSELIRINPDDSWAVVVGNARVAPDGLFKYPISGLPDSFGNIFNAHFWRAQQSQGALYVGTNDWSWAWRNTFLNPLLRHEYGFDIYGSCDGRYWWTMTRNAFGDGLYNFGARTMETSPFGGFVGSTNHVEGTTVWQANSTWCGTSGTSSRTGSGMMPNSESVVSPDASETQEGNSRGQAQGSQRPQRLLSDVQKGGTVLSWDAVPDATQYQVVRAEYQMNVGVNVEVPPTLPGGQVLTMPRIPMDPGQGTQAQVDILDSESFSPIGTTTDTFFVDRTAQPESQYMYQVVAVLNSGLTSDPSNVAISPSEMPDATFGEVRSTIARMASTGKITKSGEKGLHGLLNAAEAKSKTKDRGAALEVLERVMEQIAAGRDIRDPLAGEDLYDLTSRLHRSVKYDGVSSGS